MLAIHKYPRTPHIEGSRFQPGDDDLDCVPFEAIAGRHLVVEEKLDGANAGMRFDAGGQLWQQSRGHFLAGGYREKHFDLFKAWGAAVGPRLQPALGTRYALFGEWLYAKHTIFYDRLPHYFVEFDVLDLEGGEFLSTERRRELLDGLPIVSAPVLHEGPLERLDDLLALVGPSLCIGPDWREALRQGAVGAGIDPERARTETDPTGLMEGLYIKVEEDGVVVERYKYVRASFLTVVVDSGTHWLRRPILPNVLADDVDLFS